MSVYQVLARKYRPQFFRDALGQDPVVQTLQNALKSGQLAHAYLFCGPRGCGKTSLARIFAKALNCESPQNQEPCNQCPSCKEITEGRSLDVLEIDGASNRGIDEVRKVNETANYKPSKGKYKIILIDEVHMLTHEAFNALLKTLEEPPPYAKFFFATTEPHKLPSTVSSRCQRFFLRRISEELLCQKLEKIAKDLQEQGSFSYEKQALERIASLSDGALRDAESLFEQVLSFSEGNVSLKAVKEALALSNEEQFFAIDRAGKEQNLALAFDISNELFASGQDLKYFLESLSDHFRRILKALVLKKETQTEYIEAAKLYDQEQLLYILDLIETNKEKMLKSSKQLLLLESCLLQILRSHQRVKISELIERLEELEQLNTPKQVRESAKERPAEPPSIPKVDIAKEPFDEPANIPFKKPAQKFTPPPPPPPAPLKTSNAKESSQSLEKMSIRDLEKKEQIRIDNLLEFAAVELEGSIERN